MSRRSQPGSPRPTAPTEAGSHGSPPAWLTVAVCGLAVASLLVGAAAWMTARLVERELAEVAVQRSEEYLHRLAAIFSEGPAAGAEQHRLREPFEPSPHQILVARILSPGAVVLKTSVADEIGRRLDMPPAMPPSPGVVWRARSPGGQPGVIRLVRPVLNEPRCFSCHERQASLLGFVSLDVSPGQSHSALPFWTLSGAAGTTALSSLVLLGLLWRWPLEAAARLAVAASAAAVGGYGAQPSYPDWPELDRLLAGVRAERFPPSGSAGRGASGRGASGRGARGRSAPARIGR